MKECDLNCSVTGLHSIVIPALLAICLAGCGGTTVGGDTTIGEDAAAVDADVIVSDEGGGDSDSRPDAIAEIAGDDAEPGDTAADVGGEDAAISVECQPDPSTPVIRVTVYDDTNRSSKTDLAQTITAVDTPVAGIPISLLAPAVGAGETCDMGWYYFGPDAGETFTDGVRVLKIDAPECRITSHNMARRTPAALAGGQLKMLVMGDSIPRQGTDTGKFFFDNVAAYWAGYGDIEIKNISASGTTSSQWIPGTTKFDDWVLKDLPDSDVVFISLGGNDVTHYVWQESDGKTLTQLMDGITAKIAEIENNLTLIFAAIREGNPDADIVWLVYPNYAESEKWAARTGQYAEMVASYFEEQMLGIITWAAGIDGLILVDLFSRMSKDELDASLFDELHYNEYGHRILGDELFKVLNGVIVDGGTPTVGASRQIGIDCDD